MQSSLSNRKHIIPKLHLNQICDKQNNGGCLSSRESALLITSERKRASKKQQNYSARDYSSFRSEMYNDITLETEEEKRKIFHANAEHELESEVCELTLQLEYIRKQLKNKLVSFKEAGKLLYDIRCKSNRKHHSLKANEENDLIFSLDLVEHLWECVSNDGLSINEFSELLANMLGRPPSAFCILFQKMDADGDEVLSWSEYVSFLCQQQSHLWEQQESKNVAFFDPHFSKVYAKNINNHMFHKLIFLYNNHRHTSSKAVLNSNKYALLTSENSVQIRNSFSLQLESVLDLSVRSVTKIDLKNINQRKNNKTVFDSNKMRNRAAYLDNISKPKHLLSKCTNICSLGVSDDQQSQCRLAVSFMDRAINIYAPTLHAPSNLLPIYLQTAQQRKQYKNKIHYHLINGFYALDIPQCMQLFTINNKKSTELLLVGETYGTVALYDYHTHNCISRGKFHSPSGNTSGPCVVKKVARVPRIGIVSSAMDGILSISDENKWQVIRTLQGHNRGVYSFAFSVQNRMIVSCAYDRSILVWDPYIKKPLGSLLGHKSSIVDVIINPGTHQIITASVDKKVKIWDVRTWKCLQTLRDVAIQAPVNELTCIAYDTQQRALITAGSKITKWYIQNDCQTLNNESGDCSPLRLLPKSRAAIVSMVYSPIFQQIISIHVDHTVIVWDMKSGKNSFEFQMKIQTSNNKVVNESITAVSIDNLGKRLLTGTSNGIVRMWNFSNGALMHEFQGIGFEISELLYLPRTLHCVVGCGYSSSIVRWPSHVSTTNSCLINNLHETDVRSICMNKNYFMSGSADGCITIWHIDSNLKSQCLQCPSTSSSITQLMVCLLENIRFYLFAGTEDGSIHIFEQLHNWRYAFSIENQFEEAILGMQVNEYKKSVDFNHRLMICDCDSNAKIWDISKLHIFFSESETDDEPNYILLRSWKPHWSVNHSRSRITDIKYIPTYEVFITASDTGEMLAWDLNGICVGEFGNKNQPWRVFTGKGDITTVSNEEKSVLNQTKIQIFGKEKSLTESEEKSNNECNTVKNSRPSYFDTHPIYYPKFIHPSVTQSIVHTLMDDRNAAPVDIEQKPKSNLEATLDKMVVDFMKAKKSKWNYKSRRRSRRYTRIYSSIDSKKLQKRRLSRF